MGEKLLEIDKINFSYKSLDKDFLREKAIFFKNSCLLFIEKNGHVKNEFESRKDLIDKCENKKIDGFIGSIGQTYEEHEKLLPKEVSQAWAEFILYLTNCVTKTADEFIEKDGRYYIAVHVTEKQ